MRTSSHELKQTRCKCILESSMNSINKTQNIKTRCKCILEFSMNSTKKTQKMSNIIIIPSIKVLVLNMDQHYWRNDQHTKKYKRSNVMVLNWAEHWWLVGWQICRQVMISTESGLCWQAGTLSRVTPPSGDWQACGVTGQTKGNRLKSLPVKTTNRWMDAFFLHSICLSIFSASSVVSFNYFYLRQWLA